MNHIEILQAPEPRLRARVAELDRADCLAIPAQDAGWKVSFFCPHCVEGDDIRRELSRRYGGCA